MKSALIAFCGIDGSGKSSLARGLSERLRLPANDAISVANSYDLTLLIERYHSRTYNDGRDWLGGNFAKSIGLVGCFEFVAHYDVNVRPCIGTKRFILCDRYELCYRAYIRAIRLDFDPDDLFAKIQQPDLVVFCDVSSVLLPARYAARGGAGEAETLELAERFRESYRALLPRCKSPVVEIDTGESLEACLAKLCAAVSQHVPDAPPF